MKKLLLITLTLALILPVTMMAQQGPRGFGQQGHDGYFDGKRPFGGHHGDRGFDGDRGRRGDRMDGGIHCLLANAEELGLTDQQIDQIKEKFHSFKMQEIDARAEIKKTQLTLRMLRHDENSKESEVFRLIDDISRLRTDLQKARYSQHQEIKNILTDEQQQKIMELRKQKGEFGPRGVRGKMPPYPGQ